MFFLILFDEQHCLITPAYEFDDYAYILLRFYFSTLLYNEHADMARFLDGRLTSSA